MTTINQSAPQSPKTINWVVIGVVGVIGCFCVLAIGLALGFGLSGNLPLSFLSTPTPVPPTETPTPLATATPVPTLTNTPVPSPTPTLTAAVTESVSSIVEALRNAAEGRPVSGAASYDPKKSGVHLLVVFCLDQEIMDDWNAELPPAWIPSYLSQTELIAVVTYKEVEIEKARYIGPGTGIFFIRRIRRDTEVILREALTGVSVTSNVFQGGDPPTLKSRFPVGTTALYGTDVPYEIVHLWLKSFVEK